MNYKIKPKELRKISDGRIFTYTDALAERKDMVPIWPDNVNPNVPEDVVDEDKKAGSKDRQLREEVANINKEKLALQKQLEDLYIENAKLNEEVSRLNQALDTKEAAGDKSEIPSINGLDPGGRQELINKAVEEMYNENDPLDFTGSNKPRVERIEARCSLADVSGAERDIAMAAIGKEV